MGKGSGGAPASQNITQTNLPEYAEPYFKRLLERSEAVSLGEYQPFEGQRQAALPSDISGAYDITRQVAGQGIAGLPQAMGVVSGNVQAGRDIAQRAGQPFQFGGTQFTQQGVDPFAGFQAADAQQFQFDPTQRFTGANVQEYMSPYMQAVVDEQSRRATQQFNEQRGARLAQSVGSGAFGGSRQAVQEALGERDLLDRLGGIQATGSQQAFEQAAQMFGQDRAAEFARQSAQAGERARVQGFRGAEAARVQAGRAAELARTQGINVGEAGRVQSARAAENARVQAAQAAENRAAQQSQLQALGFSAEQAQQMVGYGEAARAADIQGAQLLENIGRSQMGRQQEALDIEYQNYLRQLGFPAEQLNMFSSVLRGLPIDSNVMQTGYAPYNPMQQALGAGLGAIGLYRGLTG
jgi:hypothetical protein